MGAEPTAGMRWIDCNARIGRWSNPQPEQFWTSEDLLAAWDDVGIEGGLVYHAWSWEWSPAHGNERVLRETANSDRMWPCYVALPHATRELAPPRDFARAVRESRGAVRIFPAKHNWSVHDWCAGALFEALESQRVPVLVDVGELDWESLAAMLQAHPDMPVILLNMYYRVDRWVYPLMERCENFHLEANTYGVFLGVERLAERFGPQRLVFGTNLPELEAGGPMALIAYAELPEADRRAIAGGNLLRLLGEEE